MESAASGLPGPPVRGRHTGRDRGRSSVYGSIRPRQIPRRPARRERDV